MGGGRSSGGFLLGLFLAVVSVLAANPMVAGLLGPGVPGNVVAGVAGPGHALISWDAPSGGSVTGYRVDAQHDGGGWQDWACNFTGRPDLVACDLWDLAAGEWSFRVASLDESGQSPYAPTTNPILLGPGVPGNVVAGVAGPGHALISWDAPSGGSVTGYRVDAQHDGGGWQDWACNFTGRPDRVACDLCDLAAGVWFCSGWRRH